MMLVVICLTCGGHHMAGAILDCPNLRHAKAPTRAEQFSGSIAMIMMRTAVLANCLYDDADYTFVQRRRERLC